MAPVFIVITLFLIFAVIHSVTAGLIPSRRLAKRFGVRVVEGWYRFAYNVFSVITFLPVAAAIVLFPHETLYTIDGVAAIALVMAQVIGGIGLLISTFSTDLLAFAGVSQIKAYFAGDELPLPLASLQTNGVYAISRHPLYMFSLLIIWATTSMTDIILVVNVCITVYFVVGSLIEERRLEKIFGEEYILYREEVGWFFPRLF